MNINNFNTISKFAIAGLSDPEEGLKKVDQLFSSGNNTSKLIENLTGSCTKKISEILGEQQDGKNLNTGGVAVLKHDRNIRKVVKDPSISDEIFILRDFNNFCNNFYGYSFSHTVIEKLDNKYNSLRTSAILIDESIVDQTMKDLTVLFQEFEDLLSKIFLIANHDYTIHGYGFAGRDSKFFNTFMTNHLKTPILELGENKVYTLEVLAGMFHRDIIDELDESGLSIKEYGLKVSNTLLEYIGLIEEEEVKKYWITVLKYPLFSILDPKGEDILKLQENYPGFNLEATRWSKAIHKENIDLDNGKSISLRKLRKAILKDLNTEFPLPIRTKYNLLVHSKK